MWGPITDVPSGPSAGSPSGHRWGTHDAVLGPLVFGALAIAAAGAFWSSLLLMALAIGLALRALNFVIPGRVENTVVGNLVLSWGGAWLLLDAQPEPGLAAVGRGARLRSRTSPATRSPRAGIPVPLVWIVHRCRLKLLPIRTGRRREGRARPAVPAGRASCFLYLNTGAHAALDPLVARWSPGDLSASHHWSTSLDRREDRTAHVYVARLLDRRRDGRTPCRARHVSACDRLVSRAIATDRVPSCGATRLAPPR